jgi:hypothetical protein
VGVEFALGGAAGAGVVVDGGAVRDFAAGAWANIVATNVDEHTI